MKWPGVTAPGCQCEVPVTSPDFYPTLLDLAGLDRLPEQHCDGVSLVPLLRGTGSVPARPLFWHFPHYGNQGGTPGSSIRLGDHKLIEFFEDGSLALYNLREDLSEVHNLATDLPDLARDLQQRLAEWRGTVGAELPQPDPDFVPWE